MRGGEGVLWVAQPTHAFGVYELMNIAYYM